MTCPFPRYWMCHILVAQIIAMATWPFFGFNAGQAIGATFYIGREFTQWEAGLPFDWKGLLAPVLACLIMLASYEILA